VAFTDQHRDLDSSNLSWCSYDDDSQTLTIGFHLDNRVYEYYDVPSWVFEELATASSAGQYFRENLYHGYRRGARGTFRRREKGITYDEIT
jgi:hypothetical protein